MDYQVNKGWIPKFRNAFRGIFKGVRGQNSFYVHLPAAAIVMILASALELDTVRFSILTLCIGVVVTAELFNSCIEQLSKAITKQHNQEIGDALDTASGAVLVASITAAIAGAFVIIGSLPGFQ